MKRRIFITLLLLSMTVVGAQAQKKALDHSVYDSWRQTRNCGVSDSGKFIFYDDVPQKGDGNLIITDNAGKVLKTIERGAGLKFFGNDKFATYTVKSPSELAVQIKAGRVPKSKAQKDTTYYINLSTMQSFMTPNNVKVSTVDEFSKLIFVREITLPADTTAKKDKKDKKKSAPIKFKRLVMLDVDRGDSITIDSVDKYTLSKNLDVVLYSKSADSLKSVWAMKNNKHVLLYSSKLGSIGSMTLTEMGDQGAFLATADTSKTAVNDLYYFKTKDFESRRFKADKFRAKQILKSDMMPAGSCLSESLSFSKNGSRLMFGYTERPVAPVKDTLAPEEKFSLDIWSTNDTINKSQQIANPSLTATPSYSGVYYPNNRKWTLLTDREVPGIILNANENVDIALGYNLRNHMLSNDWEYPRPSDYFLINVKTGKKEILFKEFYGSISVSPDAKYVMFYDSQKEKMYSKELATGTVREVAKGIDLSSETDTPVLNDYYGMVGWNKKYDRIYLYDKYDLWEVDPRDVAAPKNITKGWGKANNTTLRLLDLDFREGVERMVVDFETPKIFSSYNHINKESGFYKVEKEADPKPVMEGGYFFTFKAAAKKADLCIWQRENFNEFRDLWVSTKLMADAKKFTNLNPQMADYKWGSVELMKWIDFEGKESQGLLYKPENYDPNKKYPTIVYFYETSTEEMYKHHNPQPSWSIIIPSMFTSNDYVVFMPDITYTEGYPGESCYNKVVSGAHALIERGIADKDRMGLQGQSWGGYQIAYLVTRTNMFRCASPGAAVSNMTSAYGGIRTKSGMVRMFQYEHGQSRIGKNLWEAPMLYIENSPLFYVPKIQTPLLIRHDDADEAVPYSQGVEFFMALKRCGKTAWMLNYNNEAHNLKTRPARMDWSIRMHQFFDYYLKDAPMPRWMKEGITVQEKNKDQKYELTK